MQTDIIIALYGTLEKKNKYRHTLYIKNFGLCSTWQKIANAFKFKEPVYTRAAPKEFYETLHHPKFHDVLRSQFHVPLHHSFPPKRDNAEETGMALFRHLTSNGSHLHAQLASLSAESCLFR
mmetsp:Transcript_17246/g.36376  ORF Transcript_17246/g.36376 Transcript_17246/m.36376 type:complete len:122 (+) Transcript_17246:1481-1846(+)